ncbi:diketogulonate reductase-like aldo/keto reductase [Streptomyces sp. CZ24]|nr:diketogulonate reductase-like aldo/keto reductase [Streptomyces sp. CZ24]
MSKVPPIILNNGVQMPQLGFGVWQVPDDEAFTAVGAALDAGYRSIDTAAAYGNEEGTGKAIARSGIPREELFVTTKLWNSDHGYDAALRAFDSSLEKLGLDHVDLYLIHWPLPAKDTAVDTYKALEKIYSEGRARAIGVSNFLPEHLERLIDATSVIPAVNQIELHPHLQQRAPPGSTTTSRASPPRRGPRSARARACWRCPLSSPSRGSTTSPPPRWCCAGTSSWATSPSRSP